MYTQPTEPSGIGQVLDKAFQLTKASIAKVWWMALLSAIAGSAGDLYDVSVRGQAVLQQTGLQRDGLYWTIAICGALASIVFAGMIYLRQHAIATGQPGGGEFGIALRKLPITFAAIILFILAVGAGTVLLIVPGLILMVTLVLFQLFVLIEDEGPLSSLKASHKLVWGNWGRTFTLLLVGLIIVIVLYFMIGFVTALVVMLLAGGDAMMAALLTLLLVMVAVAIVVGPFFAALYLSIYYDLKLRKQGADLAARVGALAT